MTFSRQQIDHVLYEQKQPWMPHYPYIAPGIFMSYLGPVHVVLMDEEVTEAGFAKFIESSDLASAGAPDTERGATLFHFAFGARWSTATVSERVDRLRQTAAVTKKHEAKLARVCTCVAVVAGSRVTRAAIRTFNSLASQPWPTSAFDNAADAFRYCVRLTPQIPTPDLLFAAYAAAVERYVPSLKSTLGRVDRGFATVGQPERAPPR